MQPLKDYFKKEGWKKDWDQTKSDLEKIGARLTAYAVSRPFTLVAYDNKTLEKLSDWYERNGFFKFKERDKLELAGNYFGYPNKRGKVVGFEYEIVPGIKMDFYVMDMEGSKGQTEREKHFKRNIESQFRKI